MSLLKNLKLHQKISLVIFIVTILIAFTLYFSFDYIFKQNFESIIKKQLDEKLNTTCSIIEEYHSKARLALEIITMIPDFPNALLNNNIDYINNCLHAIQSNLLLAIIEVYSKDGKLITRITPKNINDSEKYFTTSTHEIVVEAITKFKKTCDLDFTNNLLQIKAAMPIMSDSFKLCGAIIITYPINHYFVDILKCITNTDIIIFDALGNLSAYALINRLGLREINSLKFEFDNFSNNHNLLPTNIFDFYQQKLNNKYCIAKINNDYYKMGFIPLYKSNNMIVGILSCAILLEKVYEIQNQNAKMLKIVLLIAIFITLIIGIYFNHLITSPLLALTQKAQIIKSGQIDDFNLPIKSSDEIGILTDTFNQMTFSLKIIMQELKDTNQLLEQRLNEIKTLYDISQSINFISDTQELLSKILQKTIETTKAHHASIMLLNDITDELEVKMIEGIAPHKISVQKEYENLLQINNLSHAKLKSDTGIAGYVFKNKESVIINDVANDPRFYKLPNTNYEIYNIICVPLLSDNKAFGVINVVNKKDKLPFTNHDLHIISSIANQISLILEKVKLYELSITDGMTKLYIHRYFQARLDEEIIRARRYKSTLTLIMLDIDHFKKFNDTYGHQMGDMVLIGVASKIKELIRKNIDIPARYGGEEFAIILPETDINGAYQLAERIRTEVMNKQFEHNNKIVKVTLSLGIASYPIHAKDKFDLISKADLALYKSKENGRNKVTIYSS